MRDTGGYGAVLAERPVRRLLLASLAGRVAFSMLPLGFVLFATGETGSTATAGVMVAAFTIASALAPVRGRIVDRHGGTALALFACACSGLLGLLVLAAVLDGPSWLLVVLSALAGLVLPPLGPFTRAAWGASLSGGTLQRAFALDSAGEEGALVVAPLLVSAAVAVFSPRAALLAAAAGMLLGTIAAGRSSLAARPHTERPPAPARRRLPGAFWLILLALAGTAAALGAIDVAVPAAAREAGDVPAAGLLLAVMAVGTVAGSLLAGMRAWRWAPERRVVALQVVMALGIAGTALAASRLGALAVTLVVPGATLGVLYTTLYMVVDRLSPEGSRTQTFAWLVTANNGGIGVGAAVGGALSQSSGAAAGLWFAALCALAGAIPALAAAAVSGDGPEPPRSGDFAGVTSDKRRINRSQGNSESGEGE